MSSNFFLNVSIRIDKTWLFTVSQYINEHNATRVWKIKSIDFLFETKETNSNLIFSCFLPTKDSCWGNLVSQELHYTELCDVYGINQNTLKCKWIFLMLSIKTILVIPRGEKIENIQPLKPRPTHNVTLSILYNQYRDGSGRRRISPFV